MSAKRKYTRARQAGSHSTAEASTHTSESIQYIVLICIRLVRVLFHFDI